MGFLKKRTHSGAAGAHAYAGTPGAQAAGAARAAGAHARVQGSPTALVVAVAATVLAAMLCLATAAQAQAAPELEVYAGDTRYETAAEQAEAAFPDGVESGYAVLVCGENDGWADALSASSLAGMLDCPVMLTSREELPESTLALIRELGIDHVVIVGGNAVVSDGVEEALCAQVDQVERVAGSDRQQTQSEVYRYGKQHGAWSNVALVASCDNFADALSVSPIAYANKMPIVLAWSDGSLAGAQVEDLFDGNTTEVVILGGTSAVSDSSLGFMQSVTMLNSGGSSSVQRISGEDRYATSLAIAEWATGEGYATWEYAAFASGTVPADALAGSSLQGRFGSVVLLADNASSSTVAGIGEHAGSVQRSIRVFGGTSALSDNTRASICSAVGASYQYVSSNDCTIMGDPIASVQQMVSLYQSTGEPYPSEALGKGGASTIGDFCGILYEEAVAEGVRPDVVFAQSMVETGWLQFGGDVSIEQFNFAGLGATGGGEPGNSFADVRTGLRAQVQHLKAYATTATLNQTCVDVRYSYVKKGCAPTVQSLGGKWAVPGTYYGDSLMKIINML